MWYCDSSRNEAEVAMFPFLLGIDSRFVWYFYTDDEPRCNLLRGNTLELTRFGRWDGDS